MIIAQKLRNENIAEYLIYMWQVEDTLRAFGCDFERLRDGYLVRYGLTGEAEQELETWYQDLLNMMKEEGVREKGHLQIAKNVIIWLTDLHLRLLGSTKFPFYNAQYYKTLPFIVELRQKGQAEEKPELETCFELLYGILLLKMQKREVSEGTQKAAKEVTTLLGMLSDYYKKDKADELEF